MSRRLLAVVATVLALFAVGVAFWLARPREVSPELLEELLNDVLAGATGELYAIDLGEVEVDAQGRSLEVEQVRLAPRDDVVAALRSAGELPAIRFTLEVARFRIEGVAMAPLLAGRGLHAERILVERPTIQMVAEPGASAEPDPRQLPAPGESSAPVRAEALARQVDQMLAGVPELQVGSVLISDGSGEIAWWNDAGGASRRDRVGAVDITFTELHIHEDAGREGFRSLYSHDVAIRASGFEIGSDAGAGWQLGSVAATTGGGVFELTDLGYDPGVSVTEYLARPGVDEPDRRSIWLGRLRAEGFDFQRLIEVLELRASTLVVNGFRFELLEDAHKPGGPRRREPARMPHDLIADLGLPLAIETVELANGYVSYAERARGVPRPGTITFEDIGGTITNLTNDRRRMSPESPSRWELQARMYGAAPLELRFEIPLLEAPPAMTVAGRIGSFSPDILNGILVPLTGRAIRGGRVLGIAFDLDYVPGRARGEFRAEYEDLRVSPVDAASGKRDLLDTVAGFIASRFVIRDDNRSSPGKPARTARVSYAIDPTAGFFKILWQPLRDGAKELVLG